LMWLLNIINARYAAMYPRTTEIVNP